MKPATKVSTCILGYCLFLALTNWSITFANTPETGATSSGLKLQFLGLATSFIITIVLAYTNWKLVRKVLDRGMRIPKDHKLRGDWLWLLFLLPLLVHLSWPLSMIAKDETNLAVTFEYGSEIGILNFFFSAWAIMLFQALVKLEILNPDPQA